jgi:hypothetical protein
MPADPQDGRVYGGAFRHGTMRIPTALRAASAYDAAFSGSADSSDPRRRRSIGVSGSDMLGACRAVSVTCMFRR